MVIGRGKASQIQKEPLLSWYFEIFKEVLLQPYRHLLVIGYGFGDEHINKVIGKAVKQHGLKIYIISPQPVDGFRATLFEKKFGKEIWKGLSGYFNYTLLEMFPADQSVTQAYRNLCKHFLGINL